MNVHLFNRLLTPDFVAAHTRFENLQQMFAAVGIRIETQEDLDDVMQVHWDDYLHTVSIFCDLPTALAEAARTTLSPD